MTTALAPLQHYLSIHRVLRPYILAGVNVDSFDASLALDVTAPVEFAFATLFMAVVMSVL